MEILKAMTFVEWITQEVFEDFYMYSLLGACFVLCVITCMIIFATLNWERKKHAARKRAAQVQISVDETTRADEAVVISKAEPLNFDGKAPSKE